MRQANKKMTQVQKGKLSTFRPQAENANAHTERGLKALSKAYGEVGYVAPMTAAANGEVIDGSARLEQAFDQFPDDALIIHHDGKRPIVMVRDDVENAETPIAKKISYGANRIGEIDLQWDPEQVLADVQAGVDLSGLFYENELDDLLVELTPKKKEEETPPPTDKAEELQEKWQCQPGQIWEVESVANPGHFHRLICGDCRDKATIEALLERQKVNGVFTSPPYAMQRAKQYGGVPVAEYVDWWEAVQENVRGSLANDGSFFVNIKPHCEDGQRVLYVFDLVLAMVRRWGWRFVDELCWTHQGMPGVFGERLKNQFEAIFHFSLSRCKTRFENVKYPSDHLPKMSLGSNAEFQGVGDPFTSRGPGYATPGNVLPVRVGNTTDYLGQSAVFPSKLPTFFIKAYSDPLDTWLDPFAGSGTTAIAAENEGRLGFMVEKLPKYCAVILQRFLDHTGQTPKLISE